MISDDDVRANIAANLRAIMDDRGWSQSELARKTGQSDMMISHIMRGTRNPSVARVAQIAEALLIGMDRLVMPPPEQSPVEPGI